MARPKKVKKEETVEVVVNNSPDTQAINYKAPVEPLQEGESRLATVDTPEAENLPESYVEALQNKLDESGLNIAHITADVTEETTKESLAKEMLGILEQFENGETEEYSDQPFFPEYYILDHANVPQPAIRVDIREPKLDSLVRKVLEIAYLGGELYPQGIQLGRVPYRVSMLIREDKHEALLNGEGVAKINDNALEVVVKGRDSGSFLKRLIEVGKGGATIQDQRQVSKTGVYAASLLTNTPVTASASISTGVKKPIYTVDDLKGFSAQQLKIICNWYSIVWKGKVQARIDIVEKQKEIKV